MSRQDKGKARFLWITDPWDTLDHADDTSLRLAREGLVLGHEVHWCDVKTIRWEGGRVLLDAREIREPLDLGLARAMEPGAFASLQYRTDPPIDLAYLHPLQLLALGLRGKRRSELVNPAPVLFMSSEKLEGALLSDLMPASVVATGWETLEAFGRREQKVVLKPLFQAQSKGIELLDWTKADGRDKARSLIAQATDDHARPVLLQRYLPGISEGEQRLWYIDGKLLAHVKKLPLAGDFRVNLDRGSRVVASDLSAAEKKIASRIGKLLRERKIRLAAVDVIDGKVTDFNFTSPGLITQMERVLGEDLARPIVRALARPFR